MDGAGAPVTQPGGSCRLVTGHEESRALLQSTDYPQLIIDN